MADKKSVGLVVLGLLVVIMALVMIYAFVIQPAVSGYAVQKQNEGAQAGANYVVSYILTQLQQNGYVQIPVGNQTLILVPYTPPAKNGAAGTIQPAQTTNTANTTTP